MGADDSTGSCSGQSPLAHSLSLGFSIYSSIDMVLSLNSSIMVVSPFLFPYLGFGEGYPLRAPERKARKEVKKLMKGFSWLPVIDQSVIAACQIFNLERSYRINGSKWVLYLISPFMYVPLSPSFIMMIRREGQEKLLMIGSLLRA